MTRYHTVIDKTNFKDQMQSILDMTRAGIRKYGEIVISMSKDVSKTRAQEKKYNAMICDISKQCNYRGKKTTAKHWKAGLVHIFAKDMAQQGTPLKHPGELVMSLDGQDIISIRASTADFSVKEGSDFIEFLYSFGAYELVEWSDPETRTAYLSYAETAHLNGQ